jgi:hypothetical protein
MGGDCEIDDCGTSFAWLRSQQSPTQSKAVESKVNRRERAYVQGEQSAKNFGAIAKNLENALLEAGTAVEREHQSRHQ